MAKSIGSSKINVKVEVFFFFTTTVSVTDQFWLINRRVTDWFWLINFNDNCNFFFIPAFFVVNSTLFVIIKRINKVFHFFKRLLFRARKFKQQRNFQYIRWNRQWMKFSWYNWTIYKATFCLDKMINITRNFSWNMSFLVSDKKNKLIKMFGLS